MVHLIVKSEIFFGVQNFLNIASHIVIVLPILLLTSLQYRNKSMNQCTKAMQKNEAKRLRATTFAKLKEH